MNEHDINERLFVSPSATPYINAGMLKAVELLMSIDVPAPFYLGIDIIMDRLVVAAMPVYDYDKFLDAEILNFMFEKQYVTLPDHLSKDDFNQIAFWMLPIIAFDKDFDIPEGKSRGALVTVEGCRLYSLTSRMDDIEKLKLITSNIYN